MFKKYQFRLTNRPEFQNWASRAKPASKARNRHEENLGDLAGRLVIRNLDFSISPDDLEDLFSKFGHILRFFGY